MSHLLNRVLISCVGLIMVFQVSSCFADEGSNKQDLDARISKLEQLIVSMTAQTQKEISDLKKQNQELVKKLDDKIAKQDKLIASYDEAVSQERTVQTSSKSKSCSIPQGVDTLTEGITIAFGATGIVQGVVNGANAGGNVTDATWTSDLELLKAFDNGGLAYAHIEMGEGSGLDSDEVVLFSGVNRDNGDSGARLEVTELYYEQPLFEEKLMVTAGKIDASCYLDDNALANDECTQFLSNAFRNSTTIEFPGNALGLRVGAELGSGFSTNFGIMEDDANYEDVGDGLFTFAQLAFSPSGEKEGTYRVYGWHDSSDHAELDNSIDAEEDNFGLGVSIDQQITDALAVFCRLGWADPNVSSIEYAWSSGLQLSGQLWKRESDVFGIAVGQDIPGTDLEKGGTTNHKEGHFEAYYNWQVYDHLAISPIFQAIWNPNGVAEENVGGASDSVVTIVGVRSQLYF